MSCYILFKTSKILNLETGRMNYTTTGRFMKIKEESRINQSITDKNSENYTLSVKEKEIARLLGNKKKE